MAGWWTGEDRLPSPHSRFDLPPTAPMTRLFRLLCATSAAILLAASAAAQRPPTGTVGFAPDRLARIDTFMQRAVDSNRIGGAVILVMRDGRVAYERAFGWAD